MMYCGRLGMVFLMAGNVISGLTATALVAQDLAKHEQDLKNLQSVVSDKLSNVKDFQTAEKELLKSMDEMLVAGEPLPGSSADKLLTTFADLLTVIRARVAEEYAGGQGQRGSLPLPGYDEAKLIGKLSKELRGLQEQFLQQLRKSPDEPAARELLVQVAVAQENLAWEIAWPYTTDEVAAFKSAGELTAEIYLSRLQRGLAQINKDLKADFDSVGRVSPVEFAVFSPMSKEDQEAISGILQRKRGKAASAWIKAAQPFNEKREAALIEKLKGR